VGGGGGHRRALFLRGGEGEGSPRSQRCLHAQMFICMPADLKHTYYADTQSCFRSCRLMLMNAEILAIICGGGGRWGDTEFRNCIGKYPKSHTK
jgi:hypothetical protein